MRDTKLIKSFDYLSKIEDEGLGTTYEYLVKWKLLNKIINKKKINNILIFGLPEKYGLDLDLIFLGWYKKFNILIVDERDEKIEKLRRIIFSLKLFYKVESKIKIKKVSYLNSIKVKKKFDLLLSKEVLQKFSYIDQLRYVKHVSVISKNCIFFVPNGENKMYKKVSGLNSLILQNIVSTCEKNSIKIMESGYIDIPPFFPGLKQKIGNKFIHRLLIKFLYKWSLLEKTIPMELKKRFAHIIYLSSLNS